MQWITVINVNVVLINASTHCRWLDVKEVTGNIHDFFAHVFSISSLDRCRRTYLQAVISPTIRPITSWDAGASQHHGGKIKGPHETSRTSHQYGTEVHKVSSNRLASLYRKAWAPQIGDPKISYPGEPHNPLTSWQLISINELIFLYLAWLCTWFSLYRLRDRT